MAGLIAAALAGGLQGAGAAGEKALGRMQETEEKLSFERERAALEEQRQQRLFDMQAAERQKDRDLQTIEREKDRTLRKEERAEDRATRKTEREEDQGLRKIEREEDRGERQKDRDQQSKERELDRAAQLRNTQLHVGASIAAARMQAERAGTTYQTGADGNMYKVQNGQSTLVTGADGQPFKPAKDVTQSALKIADIYQSQAKAAYDAAKTDPTGGAELRKEGDRLSALAASIISGKTPEPKFGVPTEQANKYLLGQMRAGKAAEAVRDYELKFGPGSAARVQGFMEASKPPPAAPAAEPAAPTTTKQPDTAPAGKREPLIDSPLGRFIEQERQRPDGPRFKLPAPLINIGPQ